MISKQDMQDIVLKHIQEHLKNQIGIRERINKAFTSWFQKLIEPPEPPAESNPDQGGGGGEGGGGDAGAAPAPAG